MKTTFLNDYHCQRSKRLKEQVSQQPKASLEDAMKQYNRIKRGSSRGKSEPQTDEPVTPL
jgi:hypothetical protein